MKAVLKIILGNILMGFAYAQWMAPDGIINGGVTSVSMIANRLSGIPMLYLTNGITLMLLVVCWIFLGRGNFLRSLLSSVAYNLFFSLFYLMPNLFHVNLVVDVGLSCILIALGYYFCIDNDASTVGMDVIALIIHKRTGRNLAVMLRMINYAVLLVGLLVYGVQSVVIGLIFSFFHTRLLQWLLKRADNRRVELVQQKVS
ncbi:YitT family protein [Lacticaseibacillus daqingensis]|uniref:YitT family protein n=1 Tax=Lacticaseibacillus daqingensis TaxID=2486014 RepID=UPI000F792C70|nr:YitT family protein [Lacticaseibacillus daqingensis]